ncbi:LytR/AlgR family response regulator transcription factor [Clostridium vincentii]|uniref:Stage 0 sporulation protein A homolog n=1 Tax=Clostridium vincentii TaxID=52704 RepID=A0A2T0BI46_9CLOT|nr:LytTR family DNA-binding domain-containing protein [Clostridium vincentii]PRR83472.1 Transcriptional regulatory protein YpdB [Clostridium vincentii]
MIKIGICDDMIITTQEIESYILEVSNYYPQKIEIEIFYSGEKFCDRLKEGCYFDIIFMDIEMGKINGIDAIKKLREKNQETLIIYISSKQNYFMDLFEVQPFQFILKPINQEEFNRKFELAYEKICKQSHCFEFKMGTSIVRIPIKDIICFESCQRAIFMMTKDNSYKFYMKLSEIKKELEEHNFLLLHQSYLVNFEYIKEMHYSHAVLLNNQVINISEKRRKDIRKEYIIMIRRIKINV